jgi:hypothetical protein
VELKPSIFCNLTQWIKSSANLHPCCEYKLSMILPGLKKFSIILSNQMKISWPELNFLHKLVLVNNQMLISVYYFIYYFNVNLDYYCKLLSASINNDINSNRPVYFRLNEKGS